MGKQQPPVPAELALTAFDVTPASETSLSPELRTYFQVVCASEIPMWVKGERTPSHIAVVIKEIITLARKGL